MRTSGILMHITSLPGAYGIGTMGAEAFSFVDFLKKAGQTYWQILPLSPTGYGDSPYQSCSTYAGNHYLIDFDLLIQEGLLSKEEVDGIYWCGSPTKVDYGAQYNGRLKVLRLAYSRFTDTDESFARFRAQHDSWLPDFALFMALKDEMGGAPWFTWEEGLKRRRADAISDAFVRLQEQIQFYCFVQYLFYTQWNALRSYAHENGVKIIGDVPIYVPYDSADVWTAPEFFQLDEALAPTDVAGVPPDYFSEDGQLWGNPLYRWDLMAQDGYGWWVRRLAAANELYDVVRFDHFRGFESYWSVPAQAPTAKSGRWVKGPDMDFIGTIQRELPQLEMIAEDLGVLTQEVIDMRDASGLPGMQVLGFAFDSREPSDYLPYKHIPNAVCYTGTHDNMTMRQWFDTATEDGVAYAKEYMALTEEEGYVWGVIRTAEASACNMCIIQMQDFLDLGGEARMNFPGTMGSNWTWRAEAGFASDALAQRIYRLTKLYGRCPEEKTEKTMNGDSIDEL